MNDADNRGKTSLDHQKSHTEQYKWIDCDNSHKKTLKQSKSLMIMPDKHLYAIVSGAMNPID